MPKRKLKTHLYAGGHYTYCGKAIDNNTGSLLNRDGTVSSNRVGDEVQYVTCTTCLKASATPKGRKALASSPKIK
jgi:hypothetical protein